MMINKIGANGKPVGYKNPPKDKQYGEPNGNIPFSQTHAAIMAREKDKLDESMAAMMNTATLEEINAIANSTDAPIALRIFAKSLSEGLTRPVRSRESLFAWEYENIHGKAKQTIEQTNIEAPKPLVDLTKKKK